MTNRHKAAMSFFIASVYLDCVMALWSNSSKEHVCVCWMFYNTGLRRNTSESSDSKYTGISWSLAKEYRVDTFPSVWSNRPHSALSAYAEWNCNDNGNITKMVGCLQFHACHFLITSCVCIYQDICTLINDYKPDFYQKFHALLNSSVFSKNL